MLYAYNFFVILSKNEPLLKEFLKLTWTELMNLDQTKGKHKQTKDKQLFTTRIKKSCSF